MTSLMKLHIWYLPVSVLFAVVVVDDGSSARAHLPVNYVHACNVCVHVISRCVFDVRD